jgi:hypothetical protein
VPRLWRLHTVAVYRLRLPVRFELVFLDNFCYTIYCVFDGISCASISILSLGYTRYTCMFQLVLVVVLFLELEGVLYRSGTIQIRYKILYNICVLV